MQVDKEKSKLRISRNKFLGLWIIGCNIIFYAMALAAIFGYNLVPAGSPASYLEYLLIGSVGGMLMGMLRQWLIRRHFGLDIKAWTLISAVLNGFAFTAAFFMLRTGETLIYLIMSVILIFSAASAGHAILLRKHVKNAWLYFATGVISPLTYIVPLIGSFLPSAVSAFILIKLFEDNSHSNILNHEIDNF